MIFYAFKKSCFNIIIIIILIFINALINRNINNNNIIINLFVIDLIFRFIDFCDFINKTKRKRYRDNNFYFYNKYINHVIVNYFLKRIVEKCKALFRLINVFFATLNILDSKNV